MNVAIILAGGIGSRTGLDIPKQFYKINNKEVIAYTLCTFENTDEIDKIVVVCVKEYFQYMKKILKDNNIKKCDNIIENGNTRQDSVYNALKYLERLLKKDDIVLIHDGVRAMLKSEDIKKCIDYTKKYGASVLAEKSVNTMVYSENNTIEKFVDRNYIYNLQTPQSFFYELIYNAHKKSREDNKTEITDDTQLAMMYGKDVYIIENHNINLKMTTKQDIFLFEIYLKNGY